MTRDGRVHWMLEQGEGGRRSPHEPSTAPCKRTQRRHPLSARGMALSLPCDLTLNVSLQELVSGLDRAQQGHSEHGNRTAPGGCNQSSQARAPGAPLPVGLSMGQGWVGRDPTGPSGSSSRPDIPAGTNGRHRRGAAQQVILLNAGWG